ncbi:MAG: phytanoyl-CoA dioxygenase [Paenibacillus sp.]|jgi:HEAT repeat protein|nr:phytanoyl-CoA dioxygenase [Paenibacillus sp.]
MANELRLLTDDQMRHFITQGYVLLGTDFSDEFHSQLLGQLSEVYANEGNPGNNLLPRVPQLQKVFDHPSVKGALTSVLGEGYLMHSHRHGHFNNAPKPGGWHKDSYWGYKRMRNHRPWWAMIMYFPQDTPLELGPTSVMPGTQNYESRTFAADTSDGEVVAAGKAGTFILIHYDIWHRSTANLLGRERFMLKFEFMRTQEPTAPSWENSEAEWSTPAEIGSPLYRNEAMWRDAWYWLSGRKEAEVVSSGEDAAEVAALIENLGSERLIDRVEASDRLSVLGGAQVTTDVISALERAVQDSFEPVALNAAYGLARFGTAGAEALLRQLHSGESSAARSAAFGLAAADDTAVGPLIEALEDECEDTAFYAAHALSEHKSAASLITAVQALAKLAEHSSARLRCAAVDALGSLGVYRQPAAQAVGVKTLKLALQDSDTQVRFTAGLSLVKYGESADDAVPALVGALDDENRYVRAHAADALYHIGTAKAKDALLEFLRFSRWCPTTTKASTFYP